MVREMGTYSSLGLHVEPGPLRNKESALFKLPLASPALSPDLNFNKSSTLGKEQHRRK